MTYYELVKFLNDITSKPIDNKNIEFLNSVNINLDGERYQRFLDQVVILITKRITNTVNRLKDILVSEYLDVNNLTIQASNLKNEINYCKNITRCLLIKPENQNEFIQSIEKTNNTLVDTLMGFFDDEERQNIVKSLYFKEV